MAVEKAPSLVVRRVVRAKRDRVFEAWTKPEMMSQWFFGGTGRAEVTNELRVGGSYRNEMIMDANPANAGGCGTPGAPNRRLHFGEYIEIIPPEKIVFTWNSQVIADSRVTVELKDLGDSTEIWITHDQLETEELRKGHNKGWDACLDNLQNYLQ